MDKVKKYMFEQHPDYFLKQDPETVNFILSMLREAYAIGKRDGAAELAERILSVLPQTKQVAA